MQARYLLATLTTPRLTVRSSGVQAPYRPTALGFEAEADPQPGAVPASTSSIPSDVLDFEAEQTDFVS